MSHVARRSAIVLGAISMLFVASCGGSKEDATDTEAVASEVAATESTAESTEATPTEPAAVETAAADTAAAASAKKIVLASGWKMEDAISPDEVTAITGETMTYFPDAGSQAQQGRPSAGYNVAGKDFSVIFFRAVVSGGEAEFVSTKDFAVAGSIVDVDGVGDKAYLCDFETGASAIVVLQGEDVLRVDWQPKIYASHEKVAFGTQLATKLIEKLYS